MSSKTVVIKLGGHAMDEGGLFSAFLADAAALAAQNCHIVIVHGGGPHISALLKMLGLESAFVNGLRVTDEKTLEAAEMALCGKVNKAIVRGLEGQGASACGISGQDGGLLRAEVKDKALGRVGRITRVEPRLLFALLENGFVPVVAPIAFDDAWQPLNVNADTAAGAIAGALRADYFALLSDVPGVLDAEKRLLPKLDGASADRLLGEGVISGGMIPKVECCRLALAAGCRAAIILDGRKPNSLARFINGEPLGTVLEN